jgi:hypothetical protein
MMKQIRPLDKWTLLCALLLVLPTSQDYWSIVVFGGYYAFFIIQLFCALGLFLNLAGKRRRGRRAGSVFALFVLLSFLLGVQGVRGVLCVTIPLLLACAWAYREGPEEKPLLFPGACGFFAGAAGFVVNHLLHFVYSFHAFVNTLTDDLYANLFSKLGQSLVCLAGFFGFSAGSPLFSAAGILSVSSIFFTALFCLKTVRFARAKNAASAGAGSVGARGAGVAPERFVALFFLASALCNIFVFIVAGENVEARYFIPFMALYAPLLAVFFGRRARPPAKNAVAVILGVTLFFFAQSFLNFQSLAQSRGNENRKGYIDYLLENRLDFGFATFWNANITTELSNGRIEVAGLDPDGVEPGALRFLRLHNWLNPARVFVRALHPGPSFLLLTRAEWLLAQEAGRGFAQRAPDYEDDAYVVLRLPAAFIYDEVLDD